MKIPDKAELKVFLDEKAGLYNRPGFIASDPVSIPHLYSKKEDIEIAAFLSATIAWGQRPVILKNARLLMTLMEDSPHDFILHFKSAELKRFKNFKHRTFQGEDCIAFLKHLQFVYRKHGGLEAVVQQAIREDDTDLRNAILYWRSLFCSIPHLQRTEKHFPDPEKGSAAKRLNMFLRWMIRADNKGVDFGLWKSISPSLLTCPLDVHSGRVARSLGILNRSQNDWKAAAELTAYLRTLDPEDPVKYDYALFGLGVSEKF
ncbi:MAG TPA: TIGR02757 family protein [Bacteroidia bacterium]|nr:TIGR02757 family protein [Bacteroidia bacterium]